MAAGGRDLVPSTRPLCAAQHASAHHGAAPYPLPTGGRDLVLATRPLCADRNGRTAAPHGQRRRIGRAQAHGARETRVDEPAHVDWQLVRRAYTNTLPRQEPRGDGL